MRKFKHKNGKDIAFSVENGYRTELGEFINARFIENSCDWQEIIDIPVGTKIVDTNPETEGYIYEKLENGKWKIGNMNYFTISESFIGEGKRFQIVKEEINLNNLLKTKDYEVLAFKIPGNEHWEVTKIDNGSWNNWSDLHVKNQLEKNIWKIKRIKRLSDGEIFNLGDKVDFTISENQVIKEFSLVNSNYITVISEASKDNLLVIKKVKPFLFITEDGVNIYEGDIIHQVDPTLKYYSYYWGKQNGNKGVPFKDFKMFSTKGKAEEYILMNKPCLSINDVKENFIWNNLSASQSSIDTVLKLKNLVKSKI